MWISHPPRITGGSLLLERLNGKDARVLLIWIVAGLLGAAVRAADLIAKS